MQKYRRFTERKFSGTFGAGNKLAATEIKVCQGARKEFKKIFKNLN
jgi:hypothetical protein